ncbi:hypothetical protein IWW35_002101 [Coemansia sp. RSA 1878]|nr:hypothetical protein IWW35_002101 [Coemansia sp. RSA 1878]
MSDYYVFPESKATTFFIIGLTYVVTVILLLSDPTLDLLYRGNKGVKYTTMQGTRMLPKLEPRMLFNGIIGLYSAIGAVGVGFWTGMMYMWAVVPVQEEVLAQVLDDSRVLVLEDVLVPEGVRVQVQGDVLVLVPVDAQVQVQVDSRDLVPGDVQVQAQEDVRVLVPVDAQVLEDVRVPAQEDARVPEVPQMPEDAQVQAQEDVRVLVPGDAQVLVDAQILALEDAQAQVQGLANPVPYARHPRA